MLEFADAQALIDGITTPTRISKLSLADAAGCVLAADIVLGGDQPGFDRAAMDGYAINLVEGQASYPVIGTVHAGETAEQAPAAGEAIRIMTGAPCPADVAVVPIECTDSGTTVVTLQDPGSWQTGANIARQGEDGRKGAIIAGAGTHLTGTVLAAIAMAGARTVNVHDPLRIGIVTTGDEVGAGGDAGIHDSNGPLLAGLLRLPGLQVRRSHAFDSQRHLAMHLEEQAEVSEVVVTTGGVSAGVKDLVPGTLTDLGFETILHKVAIQPGKPVLICHRPSDGCLAIGLPGNPVSVLATAHLFLLPLLGRFWGGWRPATMRLPLACDWSHRKKRRLFLPARLVDGGIEPQRWNGSGDLLCAASADGLVEFAPASEHTAGDLVTFRPYLGSPWGERSVLPPRS